MKVPSLWQETLFERVYFQKALMDMAATMNSWEGTQHASSGVLLSLSIAHVGQLLFGRWNFILVRPNQT